MKLLFKMTSAALLSVLLIACGGSDDDRTGNILDELKDDGRFDTLVLAIETANLEETLENTDNEFTLFAPTDAAFAAVDSDTLDSLLSDPDELSDLLLYHVLSGEVDSSGVISAVGTTVTTANNQSIAVSMANGQVFANLSLAVEVDIDASNGVIHAIDAVLQRPAPVPDERDDNIIEVATAAGSFSTLLTALDEAELTSVLEGDGNFTVFAPTDAAFDAIGENLLTAILQDADALEAILLQHVLPEEVDFLTALTLNGGQATAQNDATLDIAFDVRNDVRVLTVGGSAVIMKDIYASNGVVHVIDQVIVGDVNLPAPVMTITDIVRADPDNFSTLLTALEATGLDTVLANPEGEVTVFAPTNAAFDKLGADTINALLADTDQLEDILRYHVFGEVLLASDAIALAQSDNQTLDTFSGRLVALSLSGEVLYANLSQVTTSNVMAQNGVVHVIDTVLIPAEDRGEPTLTIAEVASADPQFTQLVSLLSQVGLDTALADADATFTVFAPTNAAFDKIPAQTLSDLAADADALTLVLQQHVIAGAEVDSVTAFTFNGEEAETLAGMGNEIDIDIVEGALVVEGATVTTFDIYTTNGIIHVIDTVITETLE